MEALLEEAKVTMIDHEQIDGNWYKIYKEYFDGNRSKIENPNNMQMPCLSILVENTSELKTNNNLQVHWLARHPEHEQAWLNVLAEEERYCC